MLTLILETLIITAGTVVCTLVPFAFGVNGKLPRGLLPLATGAMTGLCFFGLLPEAGKEGGVLSLALAVGVAGIYSLIHLKHLSHHVKEAADQTHDHSDGQGYGGHVHTEAGRPLGILAAAIFVHSLLDGALLVISNGLFNQAAASVTVSLGIHKAFEALSLAALITTRIKDKKQAGRWIAAYVVSFPCGVFMARAAQQSLASGVMQRLALIVMSIAIGNLVGCLIFDFVMPTISRFKHHKDEVFWLVGGVVAAASILLWGV